MKILFVAHDLGYADHVAIAYLSAIAKELKHETFFHLIGHDSLRPVVEKLRPDIVAYSVNIIGYERTIAAHREARKAHAFVSIMGGPHPTFSPETFTESGMDAYCVGEGEYAFRDFIDRVSRGEPFDAVDNLITRGRSNPPRPLIANLDDLPMPDRDLVIAHSFLKTASKKTFYATRGCPFTCAYCCNNYYRMLYKGKGTSVRRFSVERLIREIEDVGSKYRMDFIKFGDDLFVAKADDWLREFSEKYSRRITVPFNCYLRFDVLDDEMLLLLKKAGCYSVHLSVDSTSRFVRNDILKRSMHDVDIIGTLKKIRSYGINTWVNFMLAAPGSTLEDDLATIDFGKSGRVTYLSYSTTVPMKGTELYKYCVEKKIIDPATHKSDMNGCTERTALTCFSDKEKNIRFNIFLLGAIIAKLPRPFSSLLIALIRVIPPNPFFRMMRRRFYFYNIRHKIFKLKK